MLGNNPWLMPEMVNELVGLVYDREIDRIDFSISLDILSYMKNYPLMYTHAVSRSFVQNNWRRFSEFVEAAIADGYYVHCLLDTFYVSAYRETYQREHYLHKDYIKKQEYAAAYLLGEEFFEVYLTVSGKEKLVTLYFTDYDGMARSMEIAATGTGGHVYDTCLVEEFTAGKMLQYRICGSVVFRFTRMSGPDAVLSAVLLDDID